MRETENQSKALLEQLAWARRLATQMVTDAGLAEDVVQDAWVQFLSRPPRTTGSLSGWFAKVMRNLARQHWRQGKRREDLELAQGCEASSEATADLVARAQAQQVLVECVLGLEQPYRDIVLLRYFEDLESPAIAAKLDMPASSVRTRLQRGLALVRSKLEERHGAQARHWLAAVLPLLPRPSVVMPTPGSEATATLSSRAAGWAVSGVLGVGAVAALLLLAPPLREPHAPSPIQGPLASSARQGIGSSAAFARPTNSRPPELDVQAPAEGRVPSGAPERVDTSAAPLEAEPATVVQVRIDGAPASRGVVLLSQDSRWIDRDDRWREVDPGSSQVDVHRSSVDGEGQAVFAGISPMSGAVGFELQGAAAVAQRNFRRSRESESIVLELGTARIEGRVWTRDGEPARFVPVLLGMRIGQDYGAVRARCLSDSAGRFVFDSLPAAGFWLHTVAPGQLGELRAHGELSLGEVRELQLGSPTGRVRWSGRLTDAAGRAIPCDPHAGGGLEFALLNSGGERSYFPAQLESDGSYSVELVPGEYAVRRRTGQASSPQLVEERLSVRGDEQRDLMLRGARVHGSVHHARRGTPIDPEVEGQVVLRLTRQEVGSEPTRYVTAVGPQGGYSFEGVAPGRWILEGRRLAEGAPVVVLVARGDGERVVDVFVQ